MTNTAMSAWRRLVNVPGGRWFFSRLVFWKTPYSSSVRPRFARLRAGYCEVRIKKRHRVLNHIGTVHAIAMCNAVEIAAGTMMTVTLPDTHRWIPKGMTVAYLKKAETDLRAVAELEPIPAFAGDVELPLTVNVIDTEGQVVLRAVISMWVTRRHA